MLNSSTNVMSYLFPPRLETSRGPHTSKCITSSTPSDICDTCYLNELLGWFLTRQISHALSSKVIFDMPNTNSFSTS